MTALLTAIALSFPDCSKVTSVLQSQWASQSFHFSISKSCFHLQMKCFSVYFGSKCQCMVRIAGEIFFSINTLSVFSLIIFYIIDRYSG